MQSNVTVTQDTIKLYKYRTVYLKMACKLMVLKIKTVTYLASEYRICLKYLSDLNKPGLP